MSYSSAQRIIDRGVDELIGLCRGVVADGSVNQAEAEAVLSWMRGHPELGGSYPFDILRDRLVTVLADGVLDADEAQDLFATIAECIGESGCVQHEPCTALIPFDSPEPEIFFDGMAFVLTGTFVLGPRKDVEQAIMAQGGVIKKHVSGNADFLVCGHLATREWIHSSHGRKIEAAIKIKEEGAPLYIVSERALATALKS